MTDKNFDDEIIKGLQRMSEEDPDGFSTDVLDLINRQKSEIERLKSANDEKFRKWDMLAEKTKRHYADLYNEAKDILKAEAYKEFAERAAIALTAAYRPDYAFWILITLDNLLKETVGEEE